MADTKTSAETLQATIAGANMRGIDNGPADKRFPGYAFWGEKGAAVASATATVLGDDGDFFHITGTTTITDIDFTTAKDGRHAFLEFDGVLTLTHNGTTLTLPGARNITTAAGDRAIIVQDSGDNVHVVAYLPYIADPPYITPWVAYTPTFTGFGTPTAVGIWSRRVGDTLQIRGKFTTGTPTAVEVRITLGFNGTNSNATSDATKVASIQLAGSVIRGATGANIYYALIESNVGYLTLGLQAAGTSGLTKITGSLLGTGEVMTLQADIPISGW